MQSTGVLAVIGESLSADRRLEESREDPRQANEYYIAPLRIHLLAEAAGMVRFAMSRGLHIPVSLTEAIENQVDHG